MAKIPSRFNENSNVIFKGAPSKETILAKMANTAKIRQRFVENSNVISKRGSLKSGGFDETGDYGENGKFRGNLLKL